MRRDAEVGERTNDPSNNESWMARVMCVSHTKALADEVERLRRERDAILNRCLGKPWKYYRSDGTQAGWALTFWAGCVATAHGPDPETVTSIAAARVRKAAGLDRIDHDDTHTPPSGGGPDAP